MVGAADPRQQPNGTIDLRLTRVIAGWKRSDGPGTRKQPIPRAALDLLTRHALTWPSSQLDATIDLIWIAFFFLLRPSEYLRTDNGHPLHLASVILRIQGREFTGDTIPYHLLSAVTHAGLRFDKQKNGFTGDVILHGVTDQPHACPRRALLRRVRHLRRHRPPGSTPLHCFYDTAGVARAITAPVVSRFLQLGASLAGLNVRATPGALRTTGATALMISGVPIDHIKLIGRWRSDEVFRYLHTQADPLMQQHASRMLAAAP